LRATLKGEADAVAPAGDGLAQIQRRVEAARSRRLWLRPVAAAAGIAVVAGAGFTAYTLSRPDSPDSSLATNHIQPLQSALTSPAVQPSRTATAAPPAFPNGGMFPYTNAADAHANGVSWSGDPAAVAEHFVTDFAGVAGVTTVISTKRSGTDESAVTLGRLQNGSVIPVTTVQLVRYGSAWIVVGAADGRSLLTVTAPAAGAPVSSPVVVSGPDYGVDEAVQLTVRSMHAAAPLASRTVSFGSDGLSWSSRLPFTSPPDPVGAVVAYEVSAADGGPARLAATPVRFSTPTLVSYPHYFYGVKNGRIAKMSSRDGASVRYLTAPQSHLVSDPQLVGETVYYLRSTGTCGTALMSVPATGGSSTEVATSQGSYDIRSFGVSPDGTKLALFEATCPNRGPSQPQGMLVSSVRNGFGQPHVIQFPSFPPLIVGDPAWEPDGVHVDAVVRTGNMASVVRYNAFNATSWTDSTDVCAASDGMPETVAVDGAGTAWVAVQNGQNMQVLRCTGGSAAPAFSVASVVNGTDTPLDVAVTRDGAGVLVTDFAGRVWRWSTDDASATQLSPKVAQPQVTW